MTLITKALVHASVFSFQVPKEEAEDDFDASSKDPEARDFSAIDDALTDDSSSSSGGDSDDSDGEGNKKEEAEVKTEAPEVKEEPMEVEEAKEQRENVKKETEKKEDVNVKVRMPALLWLQSLVRLVPGSWGPVFCKRKSVQTTFALVDHCKFPKETFSLARHILFSKVSLAKVAQC